MIGSFYSFLKKIQQKQEPKTPSSGQSLSHQYHQVHMASEYKKPNNPQKPQQKQYIKHWFCNEDSSDEDNEQQDQQLHQHLDFNKILRSRVPNTQIHPFNGIGMILSTYIRPQSKQQIPFRGTGFVVGKNVILTAMHNLFFDTVDNKSLKIKQTINDFAHRIQFFHESMLRQGKPQKQGIKVIKYLYNKKYIDEKNQLSDFAVLKLQENSVIKDQYMLKLNFNFQIDASSSDTEILTSGYSGSLNIENDRYNQYSIRSSFQLCQFQEKEQQFWYRFDPKKGVSGGPVLIKKTESSFYEVVGIHKGKKGYTLGHCNSLKQINIDNPKFQDFFMDFNINEFIQSSWKQIKIPTSILQNASKQEQANLYFELGNFYKIKHNYKEALKNYQICKNIVGKIYGQESQQMESILENMGITYNLSGEYEYALEFYNKCLKIRRTKVGEESKEAAVTLEHIGVVHTKKTEHKKAIDRYIQCLKIREKIFGADSTEVATVKEKIGVSFLRLGDNKNAQKQLLQCLQIKKKRYGPQSVHVAQTLVNIGMFYYSINDNQQSLDYYSKSLKNYSKCLGPNSLQVAQIQINMGAVFHKLKMNDQAIQIFKKGLKIRIKILGNDSISVAQVLSNIAVVSEEIGDFEQAIQNLNQCAKIYIRQLGQISTEATTALSKIKDLQKFNKIKTSTSNV